MKRDEIKEPIPRRIRIMADYGGAYAWDEDGIGTGIAEYFQDRPEYEQLEAVEQELVEWDTWFETSDLPDDFNFPWDDFHVKGLELAKRLAGLLKGSPPVFYQPPYEDPFRRGSDDISIG